MARLRQSPRDTAALEAVREYCDDRADFATWAEALELHTRALTEAEEDPAEIGALHFRLGNLWRDELKRSDRALAHYRAAIDFDAAQRPAMTAARTIYQDAGRWDQVAKLLSREADSLPKGQKRVALLAELASVYSERLNERKAALEVLREASELAPGDLHVRHQLATVLLDLADAESDAKRAGQQRREAADVLCAMAQAVSDDYALAYLEAALDAVPEHARGLALLDTVAPRLGRKEVCAARWVAAIQAAPNAPETRELRLKLARAYKKAGQNEDARACLAPLLDKNDAEAQAVLGKALAPSHSIAPPPPPFEEHEQEEVTLLDPEIVRSDDTGPVTQGPARDAKRQKSSVANTRPLRPETVSSPLDDLARLGQADAASTAELGAAPAVVEEEVELTTVTTSLDDLAKLETMEARAFSEPSAAKIALGDSEAPLEAADAQLEEDESDDDADDRAEKADAAAADEEEAEAGEVDEDEVSEELDEAELGDEAAAAPASDSVEAREPSAPVATDAKAAARKAVQDALDALADDDDDRDNEEHELSGEVTQARAFVDIPAAARADGPESDVLERTPHVPLKMPRSERPPANTASAERRVVSERSPAPSEPAEDELTKLRKELERRLKFKDRRGAAEIAESILERESTDAAAIEALQDHLQASRDYRRQRDLAIRLANETSFDNEARLQHWHEVANLSEEKLGDPQGAWSALQSVLALDPTDEGAVAKLRAGYTRAERWEALSDLLEARITSTSDAGRKAALWRELGALREEHLKRPEQAIEAYRHAQQLQAEPADDEVLGRLFLQTNQLGDAAKALEAQLARCDEPDTRVTLLRTLSELYEDKLSDLERAYETSEMLLALRPLDDAALDRLERIDTRCQRFDRLLGTLEARLAAASPEALPAALLRIADIALEHLHDIPRALDSARRAFEVNPGDRRLWPRVQEIYRDSQRGPDFVEMLWDAAKAPENQAAHAVLTREVAELRQKAGDEEGALEAYEAFLEHAQDTTVLAIVVDLLRRTDRTRDLTSRLAQLAGVSSPEDARNLRVERAELLAGRLEDREGAKLEFEHILDNVAPKDLPILKRLIALSNETGDHARAGKTQERLLVLLDTPDARAELALGLVDRYEEAADMEGALRVLATWARLDASAPKPYLRSIPLLTKLERKRELLAAFDKLASLAMADDEIGDFVLRAARVAIEMQDYQGAWVRLLPRVTESNDAGAEVALRELAEVSQRGEQLAELYVGLAQRTSDVVREKQRWMDASETYEVMLGAYDKALEATLRAFAKDLDNPTLLDEAERLTQLAGAWPRLSQVYDVLVRRAESVEARVRILTRHAGLLENHAADENGAFERMSLAFQLKPSASETYAEARRLAALAGRGDALLALHEKRAQSSASVPDKLDALLEACSIAQQVLEEPPKATGYLVRAVTLAGQDPWLLDRIEARASALDQAETPLDGRGLTFAVAEAYRARTEEMRRDDKIVSILSLRAAKIFDASLDDLEAAFRTLERASTLAPNAEGVLDALEQIATRANKLPALAAHLQQIADDAIDSATASTVLRRLGSLLEGPLASPARAAEAYKQLVTLRPRDVFASERLRACLGAAGRHQELLSAIDRHLLLVTEQDERLSLLREAATAWELGLRNRFEARDAWKKVLALSPDDAEATGALQRLDARPSIDEASLLESNVVVLPEDLHPSMPPPSLASELSPEPVPSVTPSAMSFMDGEPSAHARESLLAEAAAAFGDDAERALDSEDDADLGAHADASRHERHEARAGAHEAPVAPPPSEAEGDDDAGEVAEDGDAADDEELIAAEASDLSDATLVEELEAAPIDASPLPSERPTHVESKPPESAPPSPWESVKAPLRAAAAAPSALLLELASFDARADEIEDIAGPVLEDATLELEAAEEIVVAVPADLNALSSLVDLSASRPPPRIPTRVPPPPPAASRGRSMPPAPPTGGRSVPPPPGGRSVPPPRPSPSMPPPPRRG